MRRQKPFVHWNVRTLVNCADCRGELLDTFVAAIKARACRLAVDLVRRAYDAAMWTDRAVRPADRFEMRPSGGFVIENRVCDIDGHWKAPKMLILSHFRACLSSA